MITKHTTIAVSKDVRDKLARLGSKDSSFDDILRGLLESEQSK